MDGVGEDASWQSWSVGAGGRFEGQGSITSNNLWALEVLVGMQVAGRQGKVDAD